MAKAAEEQFEAAAMLRNRLLLAAQRAEQEHNRRLRAISKYNTEIEKLARYGRKAAELARTPLPLEIPTPASVRLTVRSKPAIEDAVQRAAVDVKQLVQPCGVYFLLNDNEIVYVGQSVDVFSRVLSHGKDPSKVFNRSCWVPVSRDELDDVEGALIAMLKPKHNTRGVSQHGEDSLNLFYGEPCWPDNREAT